MLLLIAKQGISYIEKMTTLLSQKKVVIEVYI